VISLAGPDAESILRRIFKSTRPGEVDFPPGRLRLGHLVDPAGSVIDEAVVVCWGRSAEISIHGGPACQIAALKAITDCEALCAPADFPTGEGFEPAHPAWKNPSVGIEMLRLLPACRSTLAVQTITNQWSAGLSRLIAIVIGELQQARWAGGDRRETIAALNAAIDRSHLADRLINPPEVAIAGPPNAGKSSLANALVGLGVSIVSDRPGTTRDWVRELAVLESVPIWLTDTAGLWKAPNPARLNEAPEKAGQGEAPDKAGEVPVKAGVAEAPDDIDAQAVARGRKRIAEADLVILLSAGGQFDQPTWFNPAGKILRVSSQADICTPSPRAEIAISTKTGAGLADLRRAIAAKLGFTDFDPVEPSAFTARQVSLLAAGVVALQKNDHQSAREFLQQLLSGPV